MPSKKEISIPYSFFYSYSSLKPVIKVKFSERENQLISCLLDSGADVSTFPASIGRAIGINFDDEDPIENAPKQISGKIGFKCWEVPKTISFPWQEETITLPIIWVDSNDVDPVLGRKGFFDKFEEVAFCEKKHVIKLRK